LIGGASAGGPARALAPVRDLLESAVGRAYPGAVLEVFRRGETVIRWAVGDRSLVPTRQPATPETIYDLASLTKIVVTAPLVLIAAGEGRLRIDDPAATHLPELRAPGITLRHLLSHSSGLPAWIPFYLETSGYDAIVARAAATPPVAPPGSRVVYSDLGFILLGEVARRAFGAPLDVLARARIFDPLGMRDTTFRPDPRLRDRIAPTEDGTGIEQSMVGQAGGWRTWLRYLRWQTWRRHRTRHTWRRYLIWGEVHDSNAHAMGDVSGHAGVFGTADDLLAYARMWLSDGATARAAVLRMDAVRDATTGQAPDRTRGLGWALTGPQGWWGASLSPNAFGHTGFTGTAVVVDPEHDLVIVLLTNAIHLGRDRSELLALRPQIAAAVARALL
jgi:serine-type D-Ala-D-Ala carboxypeptidase